MTIGDSSAMVYQVVHEYEVDGGFGDAVSRQEIIATFADKGDAFAFKKRFENAHVYDKPYRELHCGKLVVMESDVIDKGGWDFNAIGKDEFWWNRE